MSQPANCPFFGYHRGIGPSPLVKQNGDECGLFPPLGPCLASSFGEVLDIMTCPITHRDQLLGHLLTTGWAIVRGGESGQPPEPAAAPEGG
jgi:hypothetical protein